MLDAFLVEVFNSGVIRISCEGHRNRLVHENTIVVRLVNPHSHVVGLSTSGHQTVKMDKMQSQPVKLAKVCFILSLI